MTVDEQFFPKIQWDDSARKMPDDNLKSLDLEPFLDWLINIGALQKPSREIVQFNERFEFDE